ncbi:uncharacterized protein VTP21DRAFT_4888 [Calcarisporiella thermophila]|uniref:uncharacterized protein n=1 Tax=Calcarisporiella thermophila TaxID=911321 RepID=UPI00374409A9
MSLAGRQPHVRTAKQFSTDENTTAVPISRYNKPESRIPIRSRASILEHKSNAKDIQKSSRQPLAVRPLHPKIAINGMAVTTTITSTISKSLVSAPAPAGAIAHQGVKRNRQEDAEEEAVAGDLGFHAKKPKSEERAAAEGEEENRGWEDLDADDWDDPLMVSEYVVEVFGYMRELEKEMLPSPDYIEHQTDFSWSARKVLVGWLIEVHAKFHLLPETLYLAVNIVDRFLSNKTVSLAKLQLVGLTALFIACKYEEILAPSVRTFSYISDYGCTWQEILRAERYMLQVLGFKLCYPNPMHFLRRASKAEGYDLETRTLAKYLMEVPLVDHRFLGLPPSLMAASSLCLARRMLRREGWNKNLIHYSGYTAEELTPCMDLMLDYLRQPGRECGALFRKYQSKKFLRASEFVRKWVRKHYDEE